MAKHPELDAPYKFNKAITKMAVSGRTVKGHPTNYVFGHARGGPLKIIAWQMHYSAERYPRYPTRILIPEEW